MREGRATLNAAYILSWRHLLVIIGFITVEGVAEIQAMFTFEVLYSLQVVFSRVLTDVLFA